MKNEIIDYTPLIAKIVYIAEQVSVTERKAIEIEREVNAMKMAEYMEDHIGEEFEGRVSGFNQVGVYVELDNTVEGFVRFNSINEYEDYYYDEQRMIAVSSKGRVVTLGERVLVRVESASKKLRHIDFSIVRFFKTKKENKEQKQLLDKEKKGRKKTNRRRENQTVKRKRRR